MSLKDMALYHAAERAPVRTTYRNHTVYSGPPPVTGGVGLVAKLNLLEQAPAGTSIVDDAAKLHAMIEAWKLQPSTAGRIADPDLWPVDVSPFESKDTAKARWRCFDPSSLSTPPQGQNGCRTASTGGPQPEAAEPCDDLPAPWPCRSTGTTAFAVADADGNVIAVTQTLGTWGGNFYVTPGLGFLYNDKLTVPRPAGRGFGGSVPFARVGTVIAPTLVFSGTGSTRRPLAALGAAGNAWITSALYEMVVGIVDHGLGPQQALELPRFLPGGRDGPIQIEDGFAPAAVRELESIGHRFRRISLRGELRMGYGAAVVVRDGRVTAGADPRRSGAAGATAR
jgi:gamma-glutamyltranspeptidase